MLTFQLLKHSFTPDAPQGVKNFTWSHAQNDLVVVFDSFRGGAAGSGKPMQMLKVIQGTRILEETPLQELIESGKALMQTMSAHNATVTADQLPISALVRSPMIGIRYNLPDGMKARRYQLKFASVENYDATIDHLLRLELHIGQSTQAQGVVNGGRPKTSGAQGRLAGHPPSPPKLELLPNQPATANGTANDQLHVQQSMSPLVQESLDTVDRPSTVASVTSSADSTSSTILPFDQNPSQRTLTLPSRFTTQEDPFIRPSSAYSNLVNRERHPQPSSQVPSTDPLYPPEWFDRPSTSSPLPIVPEHAVPAESRSSATGHIIGKKAELPPRRELPFARPGTARFPTRSSVQSPSQRPGTAMAAPALLSPTTYDTVPPPNGPTVEPMELDPLPEPTFIENLSKPIVATVGHNPTHYRQPFTSQRSSLVKPQEDRSRGSSTLQPSRAFTYAGSSEDRVFAELSGNVSGTQNRGLTTYAMHSADERKAILNEFMLQQIDDDSFLTLCEDMSACWATIGLGLM